jgi:hypothetical protein
MARFKESDLDIRYLRNYTEGCLVNIERETRHHLYYEMLRPHIVRDKDMQNKADMLYEPDEYPYKLCHKNTNKNLQNKKIFPDIQNNNNKNKKAMAKTPDIMETLEKELDNKTPLNNSSHTFKRINKSQRFKKVYDAFGEGYAYNRYRMTESSDVIEQVPMIKLYMATHIGFDYIQYRVTNDTIGPRIEFKFYLYNSKDDEYNKEIIVSVDHGILTGHDGKTLLVDNDLPRYDTLELFDLIEDHPRSRSDTSSNSDSSLKMRISNGKISKPYLFSLLIKALLLLVNIAQIDLQRANINSLVATIRGGCLYRLEISPEVEIDKLDLNLNDVSKRTDRETNYIDFHQLRKTGKTTNPDVLHNMWIAENILDALSMFKTNEDAFKTKITKRKPTLSGLNAQNKYSRYHHNQKRVPVPYSAYSIMFKNLFESDTLIGVTAGNTFLYVVQELEVDDTGDLIFHFLNPIRGNLIKVDIYTLLSGMKRLGLILDAETVQQLKNLSIKNEK